MKPIALFLSAVLLAILSLGAVWKLSDFSERSNTVVPQAFFWESDEPPEQKKIKTSMSCEKINWKEMGNGEKVPINEYFIDAETDGGRYDPSAPREYFLSLMDDEFESRTQEFRGESNGCDLASIDTESSAEDHRIENNLTFSERQWVEFRKLECAYFAMLESDTLLCEPEIMVRDQLIECDRKFREFEIENDIKLLRLSLEITLAQVNEMSTNWPLNKRLECLNEEVADQRELLTEFLGVFQEFPKAFINAAQSQ